MDKRKHLHLVVNNTGVPIKGKSNEVPNMDDLLRTDYLEWEEEQCLTDFDIQYDVLGAHTSAFRKLDILQNITVVTGVSVALGYLLAWVLDTSFAGVISTGSYGIPALYAMYRLFSLFPSKKRKEYIASRKKDLDNGDYGFIVQALQKRRAMFWVVEQDESRSPEGYTLADRVYIELSLQEECIPWRFRLRMRPRGIVSFFDALYDYDDRIEIPLMQLDHTLIEYTAMDDDDYDPDGEPVPTPGKKALNLVAK